MKLGVMLPKYYEAGAADPYGAGLKQAAMRAP